MTRDDVVSLMESSTSPENWDDNCDRVKAAFGGDYPEFWYEAILGSGLAKRVLNKLGSSDEIKISFGFGGLLK